MAALPVLGLIGTGVQVGGQIAAGNARSKAAQQQAQIKNEQADELLKRAETNILAIKRQRNKVVSQQASGFAKANVEASGSMLEVLENTEVEFKREVVNARREAEYKADQLRRGADIDLQLASDIKTASTIGGIAAGIGGVADVIPLFDKRGKSRKGNFG